MTRVPHLLFVDDEELILRTLRRHFLDEDYEIFTANSGLEGLKLLEETPIEVVVSDFRMPEMNGSAFLKQVSERWPDTVRIVLSGYTDMPALISLINDGEISRFINKPWEEHELKDVIREAVNRHRELKEIRKQLEETLTATEDLFSDEQKERNRIYKRNISLEQNVEELMRYQAVFQCVGTPILIFDDKGNLSEVNYAADHLLRTSGAGDVELSTDIQFSEEWRDAIKITLREHNNPVQRRRLPFGDRYLETVLKLLTGYNGSDGVVVTLWCCGEQDDSLGTDS